MILSLMCILIAIMSLLALAGGFYSMSLEMEDMIKRSQLLLDRSEDLTK